jgi:hypothetical protein
MGSYCRSLASSFSPLLLADSIAFFVINTNLNLSLLVYWLTITRVIRMFYTSNGSRWTPMVAELVDRTAMLVVARRFRGMDATSSR